MIPEYLHFMTYFNLFTSNVSIPQRATVYCVNYIILANTGSLKKNRHNQQPNDKFNVHSLINLTMKANYQGRNVRWGSRWNWTFRIRNKLIFNGFFNKFNVGGIIRLIFFFRAETYVEITNMNRTSIQMYLRIQWSVQTT